MVLYHISFKPEVPREEAKAVLDDLNLSIIEGRLPRFQRYGIATVDIPSESETDMAVTLSASPKVIGVQKDSIKRTTEA